MKKIKLAKDFEISQIIHGHWRLMEWGYSIQELYELTRKTVDLGISTFDHADIYGDYECEKAFGHILKTHPGLRKDIQLITKCGIKLMSDKYPERKIKTYDYSYNHIVSSVENSLQNLRTDYIDLLLLHRPSPLFDPNEVTKAFNHLKKSGKVLHFGVSNFTPMQFEMLKTHLDIDLITNQIEISPYHLEAFESGNIDYLLKEKIKPLAWSPLAGGSIFKPVNNKGTRILKELSKVAEELGEEKIDKIIYSWLLKHPVGIIPIIGTSKMDRIKNAVEATQVDMSDEQWYRIYVASKGEELP